MKLRIPWPWNQHNTSEESAPAHTLWVELTTRITTQPLHYRSGDEETAAASVASLFATVRALMSKHPKAHEFHRVALALLNDTLRPYTARWHGWMTQDGNKVDRDGKPILRFRDEWVRRKFREELQQLQRRVTGFQRTLQAMSVGKTPDPRWLEMDRRPWDTAFLGHPLPFRLREQVTLHQAGPAGRLASIETRIADLERAAIGQRRKFLRPRLPDGDVKDVAGLALSGGGIRSATFCLGIVQALHRHKLFVQFDYLSTVSGGGYLGAFLSCYLGAEPAELEAVEEAIAKDRGKSIAASSTSRASGPAQDPGRKAEERLEEAFKTPASGYSESQAVRHLRNNSRYLLRGGGWGLFKITGVFVTGFLTALLILLTLPLAVAWLLRGLQEPAIAAAFSPYLWMLDPWFKWISLIVYIIALLAAIWAFNVLSGNAPPKSGLSKFAVGSFVTMVWVVWAIATIRGLGLLFVFRTPFVSRLPSWNQPAGIAFGGCLIWLGVLWLLLPLGQRWAQGTKWDSLAARARSLLESGTLLTALGTILIGAVWIAPGFVTGYEWTRANVGRLTKDMLKWEPPELLVTALSSIVPAIFGILSKRKDGSIRRWAQWLFYLTAPAFFLLTFLLFASQFGVAQKKGWAGWDLFWALLITAAILLWVWAFLNINTFAPHRYYRNRLCDCYLVMKGRSQRTWLRRLLDKFLHGVPNLGGTDKIDGVGTLQRLPLTALGSNAAAPYHLINATLNAEASKNPDLRGRDGDFFIFSRHFCGSPLTGYITTEDLEKVDPHVDLGTAMAISGAAASTNMGWKTLRQLRFLLTLFNVRLGYWMRRPGSDGRRRIFEGPGPLYFFREMLGAVHEKTGYVNLSDGGHIENLAVYELLRRQCKFIVCVDAGMEPGMQCSDLMRLQRYAAIDFGIRMHFDPADLTLLPNTFSRAYAVLVKIDYHPPAEGGPDSTSNELGWMLYLKLAVTGTEPRYVLDYRRQNPTFPHQTTANQLYDEAQFEAYRALGEFAGESLFRTEIIDTDVVTNLQLETWFQELANKLLPDNDGAFYRP